MKQIFDTENGRVVLDSAKDEYLFQAPRNPANTGTRYLSGEDLMIHTTKKGTKIFYTDSWSMWQGQNGSTEIISEEDAKNYFINLMGKQGWMHPGEDEIEMAKKIWPDLEDETV